MAKKAHIVKASVLNAASNEKGANFYVIAAPAPEVDKQTALASFGCADCKTQFAAIKDSHPFCVTCGSEEVDVLEDGEGALSNEEIEDDENLANVECSACGTHNIVTLQTASALGTRMHCVTCGAEIEYMPPSEGVGEGEEIEQVDDVELSADGEDETELDDAELTLSDDIEVEAAADSDAEETKDEVEEIEESPESEEVDVEQAKTEDSTATDAKPKESETKVDAPAKPVEDIKAPEATEVKAEEKSAADEGDDGANGDESADSEMEDADGEESVDSEEATLVSMASGDLSLERYGDRIVAFVGGIPVGHLTREIAGDNAGVFATTAFSNAIKHTARQVGPEKALAHYHFQLAAVKFPVPELVQARVTAGVQKAEQALAAKVKDASADLRQAVSIVAAGLNKGWFKGSTHVLKDALKQELSAAGFQSAGKLLDKVFSQYSDPYHRALFEKAEELLSKDVAFRNELAEAIGDMNYQADDEGEEIEEDEEIAPTEARLEGAGLRRGRTQEQASVAVASIRDTANALRQRTGGRLF